MSQLYALNNRGFSFNFNAKNSKKEKKDIPYDKILIAALPILLFVGERIFSWIQKARNKVENIIDMVKEEFKTSHDWSELRTKAITKENKGSIKNLIFGLFFHIYEICCIVAKAGIGKTLLACFIAQNSPFNKVVYFDLDDGYRQKERLEKVKSIHPVYLPEFKENLEDLKKMGVEKCERRAWKNITFTFSAKLEAKKKSLMNELGINNRTKLNELFLFEIYLEEAISNGAEMIILDSLNALLYDHWNITRKYLERIISICREKKVTFLILHHENKKGKYSGSTAISEVVDSLNT